MDIFQVLSHDRFADDYFGLGAFLPESVFPVVLVRPFGQSQTSQQSLRLIRLQQLDESGGCARFEAAQALVQTWGLGHNMQMVFQNDVAEEPQPIIGPLMGPAVKEDLHCIRAG